MKLMKNAMLNLLKSFDNPSKVYFINIVSVIALRDIMDGQELLIDYGPKFSFNENESKHKFISIKSSEDRFEKEKRRVDEILSKQVNLSNYFKGTPEFDSAIDASQQSSLIVGESQENDEYRESNVGSRVQYPVVISTPIRPNGFYFYYLNRN